MPFRQVSIVKPGRSIGFPDDCRPPLPARVCSLYIQHCEQQVKNHTCSDGHVQSSAAFLNDPCRCCGALNVSEFKRGHIQNWMQSHPGCKSPATHRSVISVVKAASVGSSDAVSHGDTKRVTGLEPATFSLGSKSAESENGRNLLIDRIDRLRRHCNN